MAVVCKWLGFYLCMKESGTSERALTDSDKCDIVVTWKDNSKRKSGGLAFDVILKPAVADSAPILKEYSSSSSVDKEFSQEFIDKKLKDAEDRRLSMEVQRLSAILKDKTRSHEANQRIQELNESFAKAVERRLMEKMEMTQENKTMQLKALQERLKEHGLHVEEVRKIGDQYRSELKERIERKLETAGEKREAQITSIQERIRQHKKHIEDVIETSNKFSKDTEEKISQKMETSVKNREEHLCSLMDRLREHDRRVNEVRKSKMTRTSSEDSIDSIGEESSTASLSEDNADNTINADNIN